MEASGEAEAVIKSRWIRRTRKQDEKRLECSEFTLTESVGETPRITVGDETIWR